ncbi:hypothetical protein AVEN_261245-1 [Araneus ventricosus]|uniref:Uncharacterized protein n=1 Tax=Araneus ventricosus TaxID=182803 RepID=A0A4Y2R244_ARAVE|nr:hypothetical protein AVEN_261245-1 [Araneus ventricosus]
MALAPLNTNRPTDRPNERTNDRPNDGIYCVYCEFSIHVLHTRNVTHSAPLDIVNTLGHAFAQVSATDSYSPDFVAIKNRAERTPLRFTARCTLPYNSEFKMFEWKAALSQAHDTSPGLDGITYNMLRHL